MRSTIDKFMSKRNEYGYDHICRDVYRFRRYHRFRVVRSLFRAFDNDSSIRHWYSRVLHGVSLGTTLSRRSIEQVVGKGGSLALAGLLTLFIVVMPNFVYADVITSQTVNNVSASGGDGDVFGQSLGSGYEGILESVTTQYQMTGAATTSLIMGIYSCADNTNTFVGCTNLGTEYVFYGVYKNAGSYEATYNPSAIKLFKTGAQPDVNPLSSRHSAVVCIELVNVEIAVNGRFPTVEIRLTNELK